MIARMMHGKEPLPSNQVKQLVISILEAGIVSFTGHAYDEMANDDLTEVDVRNTLRGGVARPGELRQGTYRYQVGTNRIAVVVGFRSEGWAVVVTAWRFKK
jgi:hypothetical protein